MLWLLHYHNIQILIVAWVLQAIYTAFATLRGNLDHRIKAASIVLLFVASYFTISMSSMFLGTPNFSDDEVQGLLDGYDVFTHDGVKEFAVMITTQTGPFLITMPYDAKAELSMDKSMNKRFSTGIPTMIRKRSEQQLAELRKHKQSSSNDDISDFDNGKIEMFDFTDQVLTTKTPDNGK